MCCLTLHRHLVLFTCNKFGSETKLVLLSKAVNFWRHNSTAWTKFANVCETSFWKIHQIYKCARLFHEVISHNEVDIIGMATLLTWASACSLRGHIRRCLIPKGSNQLETKTFYHWARKSFPTKYPDPQLNQHGCSRF